MPRASDSSSAAAAVERRRRQFRRRTAAAAAPPRRLPGTMAEQKQQALQRSVDDLVTGIDKSHLMPMRKSAFLAMAKCCDLGTAAAYQQCVQRAGAPEQRASAVMQQELGEFQQRLQRAAMACQDEVKDYGYKDQAKMQGAFESCVNGALDKHMKLLPTIKKRIEASF